MPRATSRSKPADASIDAPLRRLGGGRWQTRDERFTIEPQSGTWVVVDGAQRDDFGMSLVRGPYASLTEAKLGIAAARSSARPESPLAGRINARRRPEPVASARPSRRHAEPAQPSPAASPAGPPSPAAPPAASPGAASGARSTVKQPSEPSEPAWLGDLEPARRGRARRLIARLDEAGVADAASVVRRDIAGDVPAIASIAIARRLADMGEDAPVAAVAAVLADGRDEALGVRWRLVDGDGRPITLGPARRRV